MKKNTLIDLLETSVEKFGDNTFLLEKTTDRFEPTTYKEVKKQAMEIGAGLVALGVKKGDTVSILSEGRNDWIIGELGLFYAGAVSVPLSVKLEESNDLLFRLRHGDVSAIMVSRSQYKKIAAIKEELPLLKHIILFDKKEGELSGGEIYLSDLKEMGREYLKDKEQKKAFLEIGQSIQNDDYATITYTSGTTADPKGVILTHRNYTANVEQALTQVTIPESYRTLIILPLDHCFAHVVGFYIIMSRGASVATVQVGRTPIENLKNIPLNIKEVRPHFLLSVPALAKNFRKNIEGTIKKQGKTTEKLFNHALRVAYAYNKDGYLKGTGAAAMLKPLVALYDKILFSKVREAFGGELKFFIGGGALLDAELQRFFYAIGIPMYQGYGLSEATPVISTNSPTHHRFGSSGHLVEPLEIRIVDENGQDLPTGEKGEMVIYGENVMAGYWKNPKATAETVKEGWLYTGDMGYMGTDGFLYVLGRFKSLLIASDGEKYSPEGMEEAIVEKSPYIDQMIIYNNQSPFTGALIVPNKTAIVEHLGRAGVAEQDVPAEAVRLVLAEINKYKGQGEFSGEFPERWLPASFALIGEHFSEQNGLVNSTMKIVRGKVEEAYKERIAYIYTPEGKDVLNDANLAVFK
jgi:long-chain acyl-CoA synthetase